MITGNKGEWSEVYTLFKLLSEGKLYGADSELNRLEDVFYPLIKVLRNQIDKNLEYIRNGDIKVVDGSTGHVILTIPISDFSNNADILFEKIKHSSGAFEVPEIQTFLEKIKCTVLKAPSREKSDITLVVHDLKTGMTPTLGFSIKSRIGNASTLLNPSSATNFIYKIRGGIFDDNVIETINSIDTKSKIKDRISEIESMGGKLELKDVESEVFNLNMQLIDSNMPIITSNILVNYYRGLATELEKLTEITEQQNPCKYKLNHNHSFYKYKIKAFITDIALGMTPTSVWNGKYDANGGYIVVREDGEVLCYHIYNRNEFQDYLLKNTKLETPSSSRYGFGKIYKQDNELLIKLNLQIRFKV